jgi:hypothetical protein
MVDGGECCRGSERVLGLSVSIGKPGVDAGGGWRDARWKVNRKTVKGKHQSARRTRAEEQEGTKTAEEPNSGSAESNDEEITVWFWQWRSRLERLTLRRHGIEPWLRDSGPLLSKHGESFRLSIKLYGVCY